MFNDGPLETSVSPDECAAVHRHLAELPDGGPAGFDGRDAARDARYVLARFWLVDAICFWLFVFIRIHLVTSFGDDSFAALLGPVQHCSIGLFLTRKLAEHLNSDAATTPFC